MNGFPKSVRYRLDAKAQAWPTFVPMRRLLQRHRWATISVVLLLLFATSGMALSRMTCLMSGHSVVSFGILEDCCPEPEPSEGPAVAPVCCVFGQAALDVEPLLPGASLEMMPLHAGDVHVNGLRIVAPQGLPADRCFRRSQPLAATQRLALHSTFRI